MAWLRRRSFTEKIEGRRKFLVRLGLFFLVFLGFEIVSGLLISNYAVLSSSMAPTLIAGDRLLASPLPFGPGTTFGKIPAMVRPGRGDLVIVSPPFVRHPGFFASLAESFGRFVTLQLYWPVSRDRDPAIVGPFPLRVIGLPGDEVSMEDFVFKVRPSDSSNALTEFEFSSRRYDIRKPTLPEGWQSGFPLSGRMSPRVLGKGEYFVAADDRSASADSRTWGPVGLDSFEGKVLLVYWPFRRFGSP